MDSRFRRHGDRLPAGRRGWVPASARTTGGGGFPLPSSRGQAFCGGTGGCGDDGWGWIPASVFTGAGSLRGDGDGSPHPRGQREGVDSRFRRHGGRLSAGGRGWVPASARTTGGGGFPLPSSRGQALCGGTGIGPRIREDNGWGWIPASVVTGAGFLRGDGDGSPHPRGQRVGVDSRFRRHWDRLPAGGRGWVPASARTMGGGGDDTSGGARLKDRFLSPVCTGAGSPRENGLGSGSCSG